MVTNKWRVIFDQAHDGATNMAIDHAIMEAVGADIMPPTLRLYAWNPPCLSLGYGQHFRDVDMAALQKNGWDVVRRATGGKAILHTDELTYSIAFPKNAPIVAGGIVESYRRLSEALLLALNHLGAGVQSTSLEDAGKATGPVCFEVPSNYEITAQGKKLIGSAQVRRRNAVLQHGSLPLWGDITRICNVLMFDDEAARQDAKQRLQARAITLEGALHEKLAWDVVAETIVEGFARTFGVIIEEMSLSSAEWQRSQMLTNEQYGNMEWIQRR